MEKKVIGFLSAGSDFEYNGKIVEGIHEVCLNNDIDIIGFNTMYNKQPEWFGQKLSETVEQGENGFFQIADNIEFDGIIILADLFCDKNIQERLIETAVGYGKPTVIIDGKHESCYSIQYCDGESMSDLVRHVINKHGAKTINFISGYKNNRQSEERVMAYRKVLEENGMEFDERRVGYGSFGGTTKEAMDQFYNSGMEEPDAIICANDTMALEAICYLSGIGKKVPEDVIVTGFDGIIQGQTFCPALTTVRRAVYEAGTTAVETLIKLWNGEEVDKVQNLNPIIIRNQSCGCKKIMSSSISDYYEQQNIIVEDYKRFHYDIVNLTNEITGAKSIAEIIECFMKNSYLHDVKNYYFCFNDNLIRDISDLSSEHVEHAKYSEVMQAYYLSPDGSIAVESFPGWKVIPEACKANTDKCFCYISPLYFKERTLGYLIVKMTEYDKYTELLYTAIRTVCNAVGDLCMKEELEFMMTKLEYMTVRDPLTALYNRRGLMNNSEKLLEKNRNTDNYIIGVEIDMDNLKKVNDVYGHDEGDNAIIQIANAIRYAKEGNMICSRTGGDEYFVLWSSDDKNGADKFIKKVHRYLKDYNNTNQKPYVIDCSCGSYAAPASKVKTFESVLKFADQVMYSVKTNKKAVQKDQ